MIIYLYYLITRWRELGKLTGKEYAVKTIVTSELVSKIARKNNVELFDSYTGFKWIADIIRKNEDTKVYLGGGEESYGFLAGDFVRDKDSVSACMLFAEIAAWTKDNGRTIYQMLQDIYVEYGYSKEEGISLVRKGKEGAEEIEAMMKNFRNNPLTKIAGSDVILLKDFATLEAIDFISKENITLNMPTTANVLQYYTEDGTKLSIRPSGTEPKIKFYIEVVGIADSREALKKAEEAATEKIELIRKELNI